MSQDSRVGLGLLLAAALLIVLLVDTFPRKCRSSLLAVVSVGFACLLALSVI